VVDAEDLAFGEDRVHPPVKFERRVQIVAERFFDQDLRQAVFRLGHALSAQILNDSGKELRRRSQIEEPVATDAPLLIDAVQLGLQALIAGRIVKVQLKVTDVADKVVQLGIVRIHAAGLDDSGAHILGKDGAQGPPRHAHNREMLRQQVSLAEMKQRWEQLAPGQIARSTKDDQYHGLGNPFLAFGNLGKILGPHLYLNCRHL
jgi:hypothetical protein